MSWDKLCCCPGLRRTTTCGVCGVTARLAGVFACDENLVLSVVLCVAGETIVVQLCLPTLEVKLCFVPSEVQHLPLRRWG
jgi:hypothetical protein